MALSAVANYVGTRDDDGSGSRPVNAGDPATRKKRNMKSGIHPPYQRTVVTCSCGNTFVTRSTAPNGVIHAETCSECHPFYTGKQRILDTGGRVARFQRKYAKVAQAGKKSS